MCMARTFLAIILLRKIGTHINNNVLVSTLKYFSTTLYIDCPIERLNFKINILTLTLGINLTFTLGPALIDY